MALGDGLTYSNSPGLRRLIAQFIAKHRSATHGAGWLGLIKAGGRLCHTSDNGAPANNTEIALERGDVCAHIDTSGDVQGLYIALSSVGASTTTWLQIMATS